MPTKNPDRRKDGLPRSYEQTWFRVICGHNPPLETGLDHNLVHLNAIRRCIALANQRDSGLSTREVAANNNLSYHYAAQLITRGRHYRDHPDRQAHIKFLERIIARDAADFAGLQL